MLIGTILPRWGAAVLRPYKVCGAVMASRRSFLKTSTSIAALASARVCLPLLGGRNSENEDALRARLAADPLRPQFHLLPAKNWMNDPNGPIYWKGHYHMFFQYNPNAAVWGDMHWAHAVSDDMIHWRHLPIALAPTAGWDDADGCFTGSAVDDNGVATILYTGVKTVPPERATLRDGVHNFREAVCLATTSDPQLRAWIKWKTPVIEPPQDPRLTGFRDPFLGAAHDLPRWGAAVLRPYKVVLTRGIPWIGGIWVLRPGSTRLAAMFCFIARRICAGGSIYIHWHQANGLGATR